MPFRITPTKDPAKSAAKYKKNTANAGGDWLDGFMNPKADPRAAAVKAAPKWENNLKAAMTAGRYAKNVGVYNADEAIANATAVGVENYTRGTAQRMPKVERKMVALSKAQAAISAHIATMPNVTDADREARSLYQQREMKKLKGTFN